jgi:hypothetical protein
MSNYINEALLDANPLKKQNEESKHLVTKWEKTGLLEGLNEDFKKTGMAVMLENQARQLVNEFNSTGTDGATGGYSGNEEWSGVALPLVRRIFGEIVSQDFVSVQPMNLPSGLVFYLDFQYGTNQHGFTKGNSIMGKTGPYSPSGSTSPFADGTDGQGFYGAGRYGYTVASASFYDQTATDGGVPSYKDIDFDADVSASYGNGRLRKLTRAITATEAASFDKLAVRATQFGSGSSAFNNTVANAKVLSQFTKVTGAEDASGTLSWIVAYDTAGAAATGLANWDIRYVKKTSASARGDFEDTAGNADDGVTLPIPQVDLQLKSRAIVAKTRKLKAVWTPELAQDLNAYHSVDAEAELTSMLSEYISMEIDLEILDMLISDATTVDYWSARQGNDYDSSNNSFVNTTFYGTRFEWYQTLLAKVQKVSNEIHKLTLRGGANFLVCGPKVATVLESIPGFGVNTDGNKAQFAAGVQAIGQLQNRFTVYKNPYMTENTILLGYRGNNFLETGAVYAPYVPLIMTPLVYDPEDFTPRKGVMTRYAKKMIRPEFYGKIHVGDLDLI